MTQPVLFRGDSLAQRGLSETGQGRGRTFIEHALANGLMARFADLGRSYDLEGRDDIDLVLAHVGADPDQPEAQLADHSPMISFSTASETAFVYANQEDRHLERCQPDDATHFVWRFEPGLEAVPSPRGNILPGVHAFRYKKDHVNVRSYLGGCLAVSTISKAGGNFQPSQ